MGYFLSQLLLRAPLSESDSFADIVRREMATLSGAMAHRLPLQARGRLGAAWWAVRLCASLVLLANKSEFNTDGHLVSIGRRVSGQATSCAWC